MTSANDFFQNFLLRRVTDLRRLENGQIKGMLEPYIRAKGDIYRKLSELEVATIGLTKDFRITSMRQKLQEIDGMLQVAALESSGKLESTLYDLAVVESDITEKMLSSQFAPLGINISGIPFRQVDFIQSNPLLGQEIGDKMLFANKSVVDRMNSELTQSIIQGEDMNKAANRLVKPLQAGFPKGTPLAIIKERADMIARSEIQYVSNSVSRAVYNENQDVIKGLQYLATNDRRTCLICSSDDGVVYKYKDGVTNAPTLPRHVRCRCAYSPVTWSWQELGKRNGVKVPDKLKDNFTSKAADVLNYEQWLKRLDKTTDGHKEVLDILGPNRYKLWKNGDIKFTQMATDNKILSLDELEVISRQMLGHKIKPFSIQPIKKSGLYSPEELAKQKIGAEIYKINQKIRDLGKEIKKLSQTPDLLKRNWSQYSALNKQQFKLKKELADLKKKFEESKNKIKPVKKEPVKKEPVKKEPVKKEPVKKELVKKELVKKELVKKEPFVPSKTIEESQEKMKRYGFDISSQQKYTKDKDFLNMLNESDKTLSDLYNRFPKIDNIVNEKYRYLEFEIKKVKELYDGTVGEYSWNGSTLRIAGSLLKKDQLTLGKWVVGKDYYSVLRHEYGHHVHRQIMGTQNSKTWTNIWKKANESNKSFTEIDDVLAFKNTFEKKVSKYASSDYREAFAESFSAYTSPKYKKGMLPKDIEGFFNKLLGG